MNEKYDRLFRFPGETEAASFVEKMDAARVYDRTWIGPFVRVKIGESQRRMVEEEATTHGGRPIGKWMDSVPSVEKMLADVRGYHEIYGGIPEDED